MWSTAGSGVPDTQAGHRPWPPPESPWVLFMRWNDLAFLHWPVEPALLRPHVPEALELETFEGRAWLGITPFEMDRVRLRFGPALPGLSTFPELNVRTYVSAGGKAGIWFFSLDAANFLAVRTARLVYGLPYFHASMSLARRGDTIHFHSRRSSSTDPVRLRVEYAPTGPVQPALPGTLEHWLVERYCLYSTRGRRLYRGEIHHDPWPLQAGTAQVLANTMTDPLPVPLAGEPRVHFAKRLDVVGWLPEAVV